VKYHSALRVPLTRCESGTVAGGEFDWGGRLPKGNGGAQWSPQVGWQPTGACNGTRGLDCEADRPRRDESRP
jgi:hypothetical protein